MKVQKAIFLLTLIDFVGEEFSAVLLRIRDFCNSGVATTDRVPQDLVDAVSGVPEVQAFFDASPGFSKSRKVGGVHGFLQTGWSEEKMGRFIAHFTTGTLATKMEGFSLSPKMTTLARLSRLKTQPDKLRICYQQILNASEKPDHIYLAACIALMRCFAYGEGEVSRIGFDEAKDRIRRWTEEEWNRKEETLLDYAATYKSNLQERKRIQKKLDQANAKLERLENWKPPTVEEVLAEAQKAVAQKRKDEETLLKIEFRLLRLKLPSVPK